MAAAGPASVVLSTEDAATLRKELDRLDGVIKRQLQEAAAAREAAAAQADRLTARMAALEEENLQLRRKVSEQGEALRLSRDVARTASKEAEALRQAAADGVAACAAAESTQMELDAARGREAAAEEARGRRLEALCVAVTSRSSGLSPAALRAEEGEAAVIQLLSSRWQAMEEAVRAARAARAAADARAASCERREAAMASALRGRAAREQAAAAACARRKQAASKLLEERKRLEADLARALSRN
eukprot:PLAT13906.1.p1 GENE.PLAT13906.1~~PLAT13906.1.p1  ORF type:complete len:256 (-),score=81.08 PLAT13906.1:5-742(-)